MYQYERSADRKDEERGYYDFFRFFYVQTSEIRFRSKLIQIIDGNHHESFSRLLKRVRLSEHVFFLHLVSYGINMFFFPILSFSLSLSLSFYYAEMSESFGEGSCVASRFAA